MKGKVFRYITVCCVFLALFALANFYCYQSAMDQFEKMQEDYESRVGEQVQVYVDNRMADRMEQMEKSVRESVQTENISKTLSDNTVYQVQSHNALTDETVTEYQTLPEELAGCDRQQVQEYCSKYKKNMSAKEFLDGLQSVSLISFSPERLTVCKNYDPSKVKFRYYLISDGSEVIAYYGDMKTVYEHTGIAVSSLSKKEKQQLKKGIEVKDEEELYGILENYSS